MLAPRYLIVATPFLALGLGWAVARLGGRSAAAGACAALALAAAVAPTLAGYAYRREAEVDGPWDPAVFWRDLAPRMAPGDWVVFNILSVAGLYARYRAAGDPPWGYTQLWDPVHEPVDAAIARVAGGAPGHGRTWLALYKGTVSADSAALKAWADAHMFPAGGGWAGDVLMVGYVEGRPDMTRGLGIDFGHGVRLASAAYASRAVPGRGIAVALRWEATAVPDANARVFVHAYGPDGALAAQHDGFPVADGRPQDLGGRGAAGRPARPVAAAGHARAAAARGGAVRPEDRRALADGGWSRLGRAGGGDDRRRGSGSRSPRPGPAGATAP